MLINEILVSSVFVIALKPCHFILHWENCLRASIPLSLIQSISTFHFKSTEYQRANIQSNTFILWPDVLSIATHSLRASEFDSLETEKNNTCEESEKQFYHCRIIILD